MNSDGRRINWDDEDEEYYNGLKSAATPFKKLSLVDLFAIALIYGKKRGMRTPLKPSGRGRIRKETIDNSNIRYLMMILAFDETGDIDTLANENEYFKISEEYAKTGIFLMHSDYVEKKNELLDEMEYELITFYDDHDFSKQKSE